MNDRHDTGRPLRLASFTSSRNRGAVGVIAETLGRRVVAEGGKAVLFYGRDARPSEVSSVKTSCLSDNVSHWAFERFAGREGSGSRRATRRLLRSLAEFAPDVVHLHNLHDHWLNLPLLIDALGSLDCPVVVTLHDYWLLTGGCAFPSDCTTWRTGCCGCPRRRKGADKQWELRRHLLTVLGRRLFFVAPSQNVADDFVHSPFASRPVEVIPNGVDTDVFKPLEPKAGKPLVLAVSWPWTKRKGLDNIKKLRGLLPLAEFDMAVIGANALQRALMGDGLHGIGRIDDPVRLARWYSKAAVTVSMSSDETFGMTLAESLACGTPVVAFENGPAREIVGECGAVVPRGAHEVSNFAFAVRRVASSAILEQCRRRAVEDFSATGMADAYLNLYRRLVGGIS